MADAQRTDQQHTPQSCIPTWDTDDPLQQQVSALLKRLPRDICGVIALGDDGVLRSLTADRKVLAAEGLTPELTAAFLSRFPPDYRSKVTVLATADGTRVPREKWFAPAAGILPAPLPRERVDEMRSYSEERKAVLRKYIADNENAVDVDAVLD
ncbi:hypothetical protein ACJQWK_08650 [Exserohilum turcicum]|uniref:Uncharacterized protein n=1 Tax=Exserohilum turcicum (strain 28A) TaxID=671987 RepID=R0KE25_EXST2|nr:uncharacterized protein SETTUDRAFT_168997 [Exserohilum turcica Et28A]EOA87569.1 hypothetical protein SETTUDRAFT_168997 [Exserohilum turcica Et28A]